MANNESVKERVCDPGWNDPPIVSVSNVQPATKRNYLNKRVAFPLFNNNNSNIGSSTAVSTQSTSSQLPPSINVGNLPSSTPPAPPVADTNISISNS